MRPVLIGDVMEVARVLLTLDQTEWSGCADRLIWQAGVADRYRRRLGKPHADWGNGSLMAVAQGEAKSGNEPFLSDLRYLQALSCVLDRLVLAKLSFVSDGRGLYNPVRTPERSRGHGRNQSEIRRS